MIYNNILEAVGHTPMVRLNHMTDEDSAQILVKFEALNVGGSIKTRTALNMIEQAEREGKIDKDTIIVEPTSGNQGIGLALVGAVRGYRTIIIMPDSVSEERRKLVRHYGAEVRLMHDAGNIGACIQDCVRLAAQMAAENPHVFVPQQFDNINNTLAHKKYTAPEIIEQVGGPIDGFCSGVGTGGTITGIGEALKERYPDIEIWAAEPENAAILWCHPGYPEPQHLQPHLYCVRRGSSQYGKAAGTQRRPDVRHLQRHQCRLRNPPRQEARKRQNGCHGTFRYSGTVLFHPAV